MGAVLDPTNSSKMQHLLGHCLCTGLALGTRTSGIFGLIFPLILVVLDTILTQMRIIAGDRLRPRSQLMLPVSGSTLYSSQIVI